MEKHIKVKFDKVKLIITVCVYCLITYSFPQQGIAQRFGHGGGGGAPRGGGGGGMRGGAPAARPTQVFGGRGFNGGSRNEGNHVFRSPTVIRNDRPAGGGFGIHHNETVYHNGSYGSHPYFYHPYHPYVWGPYWHPFGYVARVLTADAILLSIANQQYYYDDGVYYMPSNGGYSAVAPPVGAVVTYLPAGYLTIPMGDATYYYYAGVFYAGQGGSFRVVPAPVGAVVTEIPEGATQQVINGENYLLYNNTYYLPISQDGQDAYEVVQVQ